MKTPTHTPGPWSAIPSSPVNRGFEIWSAPKPIGCRIADVATAANARLISAAPDLLALVRSYLKAYPLAELSDKARAVIAKAEGNA